MHLVVDCSHNLDKKGKSPLNTMNVILLPKTTPVPSGLESEGVNLVNMVTQDQDRNNPKINEETQIEKSSRNTWKARRKRCKATQAPKLPNQKDKSDNEVVKKQQEEENKCKEGSILAK